MHMQISHFLRCTAACKTFSTRRNRAPRCGRPQDGRAKPHGVGKQILFCGCPWWTTP